MNYIIFDLEATCWEDKHKHVSEIIEIGAIKINENKEIVDEFNLFIKPVLQPQLSDFCMKLTSIEQSDVDNAKRFPEVIEEFKKWIGVENNNYNLCSWGFYDKKQLITDSELHNVPIDWLERHISVKHSTRY
jgi:3'-5' exoribonuclease 1